MGNVSKRQQHDQGEEGSTESKTLASQNDSRDSWCT